MKIAVLVKQVPSPESHLSLEAETCFLNRSQCDYVLNQADLVAVEAAIRLCDGDESQNLLISMGPTGLEQSTKRALAMGIDEAIHISDPKLHGADIWLTATVLAKAISKSGATFVFTGNKSSDGQSGAIAAYVSTLLGWKFVDAKTELEIDSTINRNEPAVLMIDPQMNTPRLPNFKGIAAAKNKPVSTWSVADLEISQTDPKLRIVSQKSLYLDKKTEQRTGDVFEIAKYMISRINEWSESKSSIEDEFNFDSEEFFVFEANQIVEAAKFAAENDLAIVTGAVNASNGRVTKRIFDDHTEVEVEASGKCVVTKSPNKQSLGLVVGVGGGIRSRELANKVASSLSAELVGTAVALEKGIIEDDQLVGESGKKIHPHIYLNFGMSGAHHHLVGIKGTRRMISVNLDSEAEIFTLSDLAIVGDAEDVMSAILKELGK